MRRLVTAAERDPSGEALAEGIAVLRDAGQPGRGARPRASGTGVPGSTRPTVAEHLVRAALEADRPFEARQHLRSLDLYPEPAGDRRRCVPSSSELVARAEQPTPGA